MRYTTFERRGRSGIFRKFHRWRKGEHFLTHDAIARRNSTPENEGTRAARGVRSRRARKSRDGCQVRRFREGEMVAAGASMWWSCAHKRENERVSEEDREGRSAPCAVCTSAGNARPCVSEGGRTRRESSLSVVLRGTPRERHVKVFLSRSSSGYTTTPLTVVPFVYRHGERRSARIVAAAFHDHRERPLARARARASSRFTFSCLRLASTRAPDHAAFLFTPDV